MVESNKTNVIKPIIIATVAMLSLLFFYIPYITDKNSIETVTANSLNSVKQIKLTREYYVENVVEDIKKYAPDKIKFSYEHQGVNGVIPLPTTTIHDLSKIFSENTGIQYNLYSDYPFNNRKERVLTEYQKEALLYSSQNPEGIYIKRDSIDGKEVLRVAVTDYMTQDSCVKCHNTHPERTWEKNKWKLGDKRGVIEVITPLDKEIAANNLVKYSILALISLAIVFLLGYFFFIFFRREKVLEQTIDDTNVALENEIEVSDTQRSLLEEHKKAIDLSAIVSKTDIDGKISYVNDKFCKITGYKREEVLGKTHAIINHETNPRKEFKKLWNIILSKRVYKGTLKNSSKNGTDYYIDITIVPILDKKDNILEFLALSYDVTEHVQALNYAYTDQLTGIANRHKFEEVFIYQLKQVKRTKKSFCLAILDIDYFKKVNDTFGHLEGDKVLGSIVNSILMDIRETDAFARWGGEEFIILFDNADIANAERACEKFRLIIENLDLGIVGNVTASFGVTQYKENDLLDEMIQRADTALYKAKDSGRNCVQVN
ncbi:MAG: diguanylate cyclase (GGDEF)-like protein/PAS domain S-box-containing protein [Sulfurimonas sp.]|jgi:diguanylate cyclase (GGDEF)-like protein/PAS domain S-box-containing protein|uniref:diguanylate cyclase n=1 Tax=Sulfurimonas sp. TaxID=2022749 RepID=UPI0039E6D747